MLVYGGFLFPLTNKKINIMDIYNEIEIATQRIRPYVLKTPLLKSKELSKLIEGEVFLKLESEQHTGSFKARGSMNKLLSLTPEERKIGTLTASTGNHGLGYARASEITQIEGCIYLPTNVSPSKLKALKNYNVTLEQYGTDCVDTEVHAKEMAQKLGKIWMSPYNDPQVIGGQGTVGVEIIEQVPDLDTILVTIGGGGLISGIGTYIKKNNPTIEIIGCEPENSCEMTLSLKAGKITDMDVELDTLSSASAGGIEPDSITFNICQKVVDDTILVSETSIADAIKFMVHTHYKIVEGAAGVAIASLIENKDRFKGKKVVIVICGGNMDADKLKKII